MIIGFIGLPGTGKTFGMVYQLCKALRKGRNVVANLPIKDTVFGSGAIGKYESNIGSVIRGAENTVIGIDEASIVLPNYYWEKLDFDTLIRFAQVRKYGLDILYTSQGWNHTVKRLRDLTNYVVRCQAHGLWFSFDFFDPEYFLMKIPKHFEDDYIVRREKVFKWQFKSVFKAYDTLFRVASSDLVKRKDDRHIEI